MKKISKSALLLSITLLITSCGTVSGLSKIKTVNGNNISPGGIYSSSGLTDQEIKELDQEHFGFKTKALTPGYLKRILQRLLNSQAKLIKVIKYANFKMEAKVPFKAAMVGGTLYTDIVNAVKLSPEYLAGGSLKNFIDEADPTPAPPTIGEFRVNTTTAGTQFNLDGHTVASAEGKGFVITWTGVVNDYFEIFAQRYNADGTKNGSEFTVNTITAGSQQLPSVAMNANGDFIITWTGDQAQICARRFYFDGTSDAAEFQVNPTYTGSSTVSLANNGKFVITWQQYAGSQANDVFARMYNNDGTPVSSAFRVNPSTGTGLNSLHPSVGIDNINNNFVITWEYMTVASGYNSDVYARKYDSSGIPSDPFLVNVNTTGNQLAPSLAMNDSGNFVITWQSYNQTGSDYDANVYARRYSNTGSSPDSAEFLVNTTTGNPQNYPSIDIDNSGNFIIVWKSWNQDGDNEGVYAQRFSNAGTLTTQGDEFRVNSTTTGEQRYQSVAMDETDGFVITYTSNHSGSDVFAKRYYNNGNVK